ncbi:Uncharacterised protein [Yersinia similis]|uniref:Uncharacterized protein n=1 Tax=Yersinia similis TaxID=367190 RepID=A0A0T9QNF4_9GAMM|nr:Uncharacterised protein [Yersinia similis]CNB11709.1 Uncharacterised protein [Yersinia similis]CNF14485.1 Uncharacterised protein [Yersinia similis]CNF73060.1 Uncharacterised protein [Yersinia similis]CNI18691.1 Uncharacterised protein [Yersinia similis]
MFKLNYFDENQLMFLSKHQNHTYTWQAKTYW